MTRQDGLRQRSDLTRCRIESWNPFPRRFDPRQWLRPWSGQRRRRLWIWLHLAIRIWPQRQLQQRQLQIERRRIRSRPQSQLRLRLAAQYRFRGRVELQPWVRTSRLRQLDRQHQIRFPLRLELHRPFKCGRRFRPRLWLRPKIRLQHTQEPRGRSRDRRHLQVRLRRRPQVRLWGTVPR